MLFIPKQRALVAGHGPLAGSIPHGKIKCLMDFGQCMRPVPTQYREEIESYDMKRTLIMTY